jgi:hypothetical protein
MQAVETWTGLCATCVLRSVVGIIPRAVGDLFASRAMLGLDLRMTVVSLLGDDVRDLLTPAALAAVGVALTAAPFMPFERTRVRSLSLDDELQTLELLRGVLLGPGRARIHGHAVVMITVTRQQVRRPVPSPCARRTGLCLLWGNACARRPTRASFIILPMHLPRVVQKHVRSTLYLADLAGFQDDTSSTEKGPQALRAAKVRSDLSHLKQMTSCRAQGAEFIPSMSCELTRVLKDACGGNSRTSIVLPVICSQHEPGHASRSSPTHPNTHQPNHPTTQPPTCLPTLAHMHSLHVCPLQTVPGGPVCYGPALAMSSTCRHPGSLDTCCVPARRCHPCARIFATLTRRSSWQPQSRLFGTRPP